ncbi:hypothetical protein ACA910_012437 [Epithemia clementina (nom. ined.)]
MDPNTTHKLAAQNFHNLTIAQAKLYIDGCPGCDPRKSPKPPHKGAVRPIRSMGFRDRFQADLILMMDSSGIGVLDIFSAEMKYVLVIKDHFSQFIIMYVLPSKKTRTVVHFLSQAFGIIGYPSKYQSDNGHAVKGDEIIKALHKFHPHIVTIQG